MLCGGSETTRCFSEPNRNGDTPREFTVVRCRGCGLTFVNPRPVLSEERKVPRPNPAARRVTAKDLQRTERRLRRLQNPLCQAALQRHKGYPAGRAVSRLSLWLSPVVRLWVGKEVPPFHGLGRMLDIGSSSGLFLYLMKGLGWTVQGVEVNPELCVAAESIGIPTHSGVFEDAPLPPRSFEVVRMCQVLEHIPDPVEAMRRIRDLLTHDGLAIIEVPNVRSAAFRLFGALWYGAPGHVYGYDVKTLTALGQRVGLKRVVVRYKCSKGAFTACLEQWALRGRTWRHRFVRWVANAAWFRRLVVSPLSWTLAQCRYGDIMHVWFARADGDAARGDEVRLAPTRHQQFA